MGNVLIDDDKVILFGAGADGVSALKFLGKDSVICFCDNNRFIEKIISDVEVVSFDVLKAKYPDRLVLITSTNYKSVFEISQLLKENGFNYDLFENYAQSRIISEGKLYNSLNTRFEFMFDESFKYICVLDKEKEAGNLSSYFWQDLWAAMHIFENKPKVHFDIGSRIDGFIAHLLAFGQSVNQIDIRPMDSIIEGWNFTQGDATNLDVFSDNSIESISALCSLEHFGLGRYGDNIDPEACFKCFKAIQHKLKTGGIAYISVPIGKEHLEFNAHRVFYAQTIIDEFSELELVECSAAFEGNLYRNIDLHRFDDNLNRNGKIFGLFMFKKK